MPLYGYQCRKCGSEFEYLQKFSDAPMTECEKCGGRLEKQLSAPAFHLKGGGWYKDLYSSTKGGAATSSSDAGSSGSSSDSGSSGSSSDSSSASSSSASDSSS